MTGMTFHPEHPGKRFLVVTDWSKKLVVVHAGNNPQEAFVVADFWDERVNTCLYDLTKETYDGYGTILAPITLDVT